MRISSRSDKGMNYPKCVRCNHVLIRHYDLGDGLRYCPVKNCVCSFDKQKVK